jgi:DNA sulfur modification protein DndB
MRGFHRAGRPGPPCLAGLRSATYFAPCNTARSAENIAARSSNTANQLPNTAQRRGIFSWSVTMPFIKEAMEGVQREIRFFATAMEWGELQQMAVFPDELADEFGEGEERLQRSLVRSRIAPLISYLVDVPDHFFSALTLIILPRILDQPAREATGPNDEDVWDYYFERGQKSGPGRPRFGVIHLSAGVQLFPADGQHRLRAALDAIRQEPSIAREQVPVVLVPYQSRDQVGQLFSDLNLNAKPVNKSVGYSLESRNPVVLVAKRVMGAVPVLKGRVHRGSNSLPKSSAHVITMSGLVEGTRTLLGACAVAPGATESAKAKGRAANVVDKWVSDNEGEAFESACAMWQVIVGSFAQHWDLVLAGEQGAAGRLRDRYVFPHGLGWSALTQAAADLRRASGEGWNEAFRRAIERIDWERANPEWEGKAIVKGAVMNTTQNVRATAQYIIASASLEAI